MSEQTSEITFKIKMDENQIPEYIEWVASDSEEKGICDAAFLTIWDKKEKNTLRIDLWTKDMPLDEMKIFFHQTLSAMSDTFNRATNDEKMTATMKDFCDYFAEKLDLKKK